MPDLVQMKGPATLVYQQLERYLASDPIFKATAKTIATWDGQDNPTTPPPAGTCPYVSILPAFVTPGNYFVTNLRRVSIRMKFALAVDRKQGPGALVNLWDVIQRAIMPADQSDQRERAAVLQSLGALTGYPTFSGYPTAKDPTQAVLEADAFLDIDVLVPG